MKKKELIEIRKKANGELQSLLMKNRKDLFKIMFDIKTGKEKDLKKAKKLKKEIAQILTILKENSFKNKNNVK